MVSSCAPVLLCFRHDLPMFLHDRNTGGDFLAVMTAHRSSLSSRGGVVHSFTGTLEEMQVSSVMGIRVWVRLGRGRSERGGVEGCSGVADGDTDGLWRD